MMNFLICLLIFSIVILFMAMVYVIANLIFSFKLLLHTADRLEKTMKNLDNVSIKGAKVVENYRRPFLFITNVVTKVQSIVSSVVHIFK